MDAILVALLFSVPGILLQKLDDRFFPSSMNEESEYTKTTIAILESIIILIINILILSIFKVKILNITTLVDKLKYVPFLAFYVIVTSVICVLVCIVKNTILKKLLVKLFNVYNKYTNRAEETIFPSEWERIFENSEISKQDMYIVIEKDGNIITQGRLEGYAPPNQARRDITLVDTNAFKEYLENDKNLADDKKLLDIIEKEYYDFSTGILIKIYNNTKLLNYLRS